MEKFLTTSELARLFNLSRQTLHFYDKKDLFKPAYVNPQNGYRMYSHNQIAQLAFIVYLKTIGFSLDKIKELLSKANVDYTMEQFKKQSESLKEQYKEIFRIDELIQRKLKFVKDKIHTTDFEKKEIRLIHPSAYVEIGRENVLYENEFFYYFPTIVFYNFLSEEGTYNKVFGAYIEEDQTKEQYLDQTKYVEEKRYLCCYHTGSYETIMDTVSQTVKEYNEIPLSNDFICINIIDQFLEKNTEKFITEIWIPILE